MFHSISTLISDQLSRNGATVSVAESSTGGLISANLLSVPGASRFYVGGSVVYTRESRRAFLTLDKEKLTGLQPLTPEIVQVFADGEERRWAQPGELQSSGQQVQPDHPMEAVRASA